jgi:hypothetical protein
MKPLLVIIGVATFSFALPFSWGHGACPVVVQPSVEVAGEELSLAELLAPDSCATLRQAAAGVSLGGVPLWGSVRVMTGEEVLEQLQKLAKRTGKTSKDLNLMPVPERVTVRRAGTRASCAGIGARVLSSSAVHAAPAAIEFAASGAAEPDAGSREAGECGAGLKIPRRAPVTFARVVWNPALAAWDVSARCVHAADCVPFLVRVPDRNFQFEKRAAGRSTAAKASAPEKPLVRRGEAVTLLWDQDGIRLLVPAVCLDEGRAGEAVRARIVRGGRLVRAVVESAGRLRVAS